MNELMNEVIHKPVVDGLADSRAYTSNYGQLAMDKPFIIGLCGYAQVGKTTTAMALSTLAEISNRGSQIISFADPVKRIARMFGWNGEKDEKGRRLLQQIGTEVGRSYNPDIWVKMWECEAAELISLKVSVIADDVRFQNEIDCIQSLGGKVFRLVSRSRGIRLIHASEQPDSLKVDYDVPSDDTPENVAKQVLTYYKMRVS